jgi:bile acid:Na+ symporter, BASS family
MEPCVQLSPLTIVITFTLWASIGSLGLGAPRDPLISMFRQRGAVLRIVAFDALVVPPLAWLIVTLLNVEEAYAIGLLLVGAASAGPLGLVAVRIAGAEAGVALAAVGMLELANIVVIPVWSAILLPRTVGVGAGEIAVGLIVWLVLPLMAGRLVAQRAPEAVPGILRVTTPVATVGWLLSIALSLLGAWTLIGPAASSGTFGAAVVLAITCLVGGWVFAGGDVRTRSTGALITGQRGNAIALGIAATAFADMPQAALAVVLFGTLVSVLVPATAFVLRGVGHRQPVVRQTA